MIKYYLYLAFGFSLSQFFHVLIFYEVKGETIIAFPQWELPLRYAFIFSLVVGILVFLILKIGGQTVFEKFPLFPVIVIISLLISQIFGRSLIKFGFESVYWLIIFLSFLLEKRYNVSNWLSSGRDLLSFEYNELFGLFNLAVTFSLFWLGTAGIGFSTALKKEYFQPSGPAMMQYQMLRYGALFVYSAFGIGWLIFYPLLSKLHFAKKMLF